jgi:DNA-directed RNA polymerase specialized sigma24 family protein
LSEKEIAVELGISDTESGALRKRVARARPAIAAAINQHVPQPREDR